MRTNKYKWLRLAVILLLLTVMFSAQKPQVQTAAAQSQPQVGMVCTYAGANPTFTLTTQTGYIILPDANTMFMWGYSLAGQPFQHPSPVLCVHEGDTVTVILQNTFNEPVSIMFPGQDNVMVNGALAQPEFDAGGNVTSLTNTAPVGGSITYSFVASHPGSFIYESGTKPEKQVRMGLFGALIVRPAMGDNYSFNRADSQFDTNEEFLALLSEIDPYQHQAVQNNQTFNMNNYHPRYWLLNGRGFPDSIADNFASWVPNQPYGALARIHPWNTQQFLADGITPNPAYKPYPGIVHYLNVGTDDYPFHPHGNNGVVIGRDGQPLEGSSGQDLSFETFAINLGPGQTWDVLFKWYDAEGYTMDTNPVTVTIPDPANMTVGMFFSGSPYLGKMGPMLPGTSTLNQCGEYYIISHNHALAQVTSWGVTMTGPITYLRIDPPLPNMCP